MEPSDREAIRLIRRRIRGLDDVKDCVDINLTHTRKKPHIFVHVLLNDNPAYDQIHRIASVIESEVRSVVVNSRVVVRSEPDDFDGHKDIWSLVRKVADQEPGSRGAHNIHVQKLKGKRIGVDFHLEVSAGMTTKEARQLSLRIENKIKAADANISEVVIHEESVSELISSERSRHGTEIRWYLEHVAKNFPELTIVQAPAIRHMESGSLHVTIKVAFDPGISQEAVNKITSSFEAAIKSGYPAIERVDIVQEPLR